MGRPKKNVEMTIVEDAKVHKIENQYVVLKEKKTYTFTNKLPGMIFFTREDGTVEAFEGHQTRDDITEKERKVLMNNEVYKIGYLIEETEEDVEEVVNKNTLNDNQLNLLLDKYSKDTAFLKNWISKMDSDFAIERVKQAMIDKNMPSSLVLYCDVKLNELKEAYLEEMKAPVDKLPDTIKE